VPQLQIDNLPINGRNFLLLYPTYPLIFENPRATFLPPSVPLQTADSMLVAHAKRSNLVSVDGADAGDNSVNGIRSTISQEGVQEFQLILSNYNAEYGRATGGVIKHRDQGRAAIRSTETSSDSSGTKPFRRAMRFPVKSMRTACSKPTKRATHAPKAA